MGVYINGIRMPTEEEISKCIIIRHDGEVWTVKFDNLVDGGFVACYPTNPMRAVPVTEHGRLIDADELMKSDRMVGKLMMYGGEYVYTQAEIDRAPTIIPTEEGET